VVSLTIAAAIYDRWPSLAWKLSWDVTPTQVNSALHLSGVAKSSTSFGWGKVGKVTSAGWQVTLCDPIYHVVFRSGVLILITNCYICVYFTFTVTNRGDKHRRAVVFSLAVEDASTWWGFCTVLWQCVLAADGCNLMSSSTSLTLAEVIFHYCLE